MNEPGPWATIVETCVFLNVGKRIRTTEQGDGRYLSLRPKEGRLAIDAKERVDLRNAVVPGFVDTSV